MPTVYSPPVSTYVALATTTLGASAASVTFSSISGSYRDLVLIANARTDRAATSDIYKITLNASGTGYSRVVMYGTGSTADSYADASLSAITPYALTGNTATSGVFGFLKMQIMDYSATDKHKTILNNEDATGLEVSASAYTWANTNAVTSIEIDQLLGSNFASGSTFSLYGIEA